MYGKASEPRMIMAVTAQAGRRPGSDPARVDVLGALPLRARHDRAPAAAERPRPRGTPVAVGAQPAVAGGVEVVRWVGRSPQRAQEEASSAWSAPVMPPAEDGLGPASAPWPAVEGTPASSTAISRCGSLTLGQVPRPAGMPPSTPSAGPAEEATAAGSVSMPDIAPPHRLLPAAGARRVAVNGEEFHAGAARREQRSRLQPTPVGLAGGAGWGIPGPAAQAGGPWR